jgi:hypothetical protein
MSCIATVGTKFILATGPKPNLIPSFYHLSWCQQQKEGFNEKIKQQQHQ